MCLVVLIVLVCNSSCPYMALGMDYDVVAFLTKVQLRFAPNFTGFAAIFLPGMFCFFVNFSCFAPSRFKHAFMDEITLIISQRNAT